MSEEFGDEHPGNVSTPDADEPLPIRFSYLKAMGRSPAHCKVAMDTDRGKLEEAPNANLERGTAVHHMLFGTGRVIGYAEGKTRRGKEWDAFREANPGALILTANEFDQVQRMVDAVVLNKLAMELIDLNGGAQYEQTKLFKHGGRTCRITPDIEGSLYLGDIKTCENSDPAIFQWAVRRYSYHSQMAWYMDGLNAVRTQDRRAFAERTNADLYAVREAFIIAVESKPPYPVSVMRLSDHAIELGRRQYSLWLERFLACEQANEWPGYAQSVVELDVPEDETELVFEEDGE